MVADHLELAREVKGLEKEVGFEEELGSVGINFMVLPEDPTPAELTAAMAGLPGRLAWWGARQREAEAELAELEAQHEIAYSVAYRLAREAMGAKATESAVKQAIIDDGKGREDGEEVYDFLTWKKRLANAEHKVGVLKAAAKAWETMGVLLPSMCRLCEAEIRATNIVYRDRSRDQEPAPREEPSEQRKEEEEVKRPAERSRDKGGDKKKGRKDEEETSAPAPKKQKAPW